MRIAVGVLALCGCTAIFDLRSAPNGDRDADGAADDTDNCPAIYNPDQSNFDGDESGDACDQCIATAPDEDEDGIPDPCDGCVGNGIDLDMDSIDDNCTCVPTGVDVDLDGLDDNCDPCTQGPQDDEDGDGVMDACDNCPGIYNVGQANTGEAVPDLAGDVCDPGGAPSNRVFDNFKTDNSNWFQFGTGWSRDDGVYRLSPEQQSLRGLGVAMGHFRVFTAIKLSGAIGGGAVREAGVYAGEARLPLVYGAFCAVSNDGALTLAVTENGTKTTLGNATSIDVTQLFVVELDVSPKENQLTCRVYQSNVHSELVEQVGEFPASYPGIFGSTQAEFSFYDLVSDPL